MPTISEKVDVDRTTLLLPTNGQEPDAEALRKFYDEIEIQETEDNPTIKQDNGESCTLEKSAGKSAGKILAQMRNNPSITIAELCKILGLSDKGVRKNIEKLKRRSLLTRIGPDKGGYWKVIEENI